MLAGCGFYAAITGTKEAPRPCPRVSVLNDAASVTKFREGGGTDLIDVLYEGKITGFEAECRYDVDDETGIGQVDVLVAVKVRAVRGPADRERKANFRYFIALTDTKRNILGKRPFELSVGFPGNLSRVTADDEPVGLSIPLSKGKTGADFQVFVGFQLDRAEWEFNSVPTGTPTRPPTGAR